MVTETAINIAMNFLSVLPDEMAVRKAYLFGSYAKSNFSGNSDIDIAVIVGSTTDIFDIQMQLLRLRRNIDLRIEPHPIKEKDFSGTNPFAVEIIRSGIKLV
jgi:predicted nucleotidyltransferase